MYKLTYFIIILLISSCSSVSKRDNYFANETIYNYLIENEVDLQSEKDVSDEVLCFFSFSPEYVVNLINQPEKLQEEMYDIYYRDFDYTKELAVKNLLGGYSDETRPDQDRLAYGLKELEQISERWKNEVLNRNIVNNCKRSVVDSFSTALNNYSPKEADGISFKNEYSKKLINFFSTAREYNKYTNDSKKSSKYVENNAAEPSASVKSNIILEIENNGLVSKAAFANDVVGGNSSYSIFWIWMPKLKDKDYDSIAKFFCPVFKKNGLSGILVSIKKNNSYDTLGRGRCR